MHAHTTGRFPHHMVINAQDADGNTPPLGALLRWLDEDPAANHWAQALKVLSRASASFKTGWFESWF